MLVVLRVHAGRDDGAVGALAHCQLVLGQRVGGQLPRQLDLVVNCAVLVEAPVEGVSARQSTVRLSFETGEGLHGAALRQALPVQVRATAWSFERSKRLT